MYAAVPLSLETLTLIKWSDKHGREQAFRLVDEVSAKWINFGVRVGLNMNTLEAWEEQFNRNHSKCWLKVMAHWLEGGGTLDYPATWEGLDTLLKDCRVSEVAANLQKAVSGNHTLSH